MSDKPASPTAKPSRPGREDRLKAALKANMGRRKAQARARTRAEADAETGGPDRGAGDNKAEEE